MNEVINPWFVYLIMQADTIVSLFGHFIFFSIVLLIVSIIIRVIYAAHVSNGGRPNEEDVKIIEWANKCYTRSLYAIIFCSLMYASIPRTNSLCVIYVVPKLANNESIQTEFKDLYNAAKQELKDKFGAKEDE